MDLNKMVEELNEPLKSFVVDFVMDIYDHRNEIDEDIITLLKSIKDRYIKNAPLD
jgi:hypothetical protein